MKHKIPIVFLSSFFLLATPSVAEKKSKNLMGIPYDEELYCMAETIYHEARNQNMLGQIAVAIVIKNRMKDKRWPSTACEVVKQGHYWNSKPLRDQCQFSYWCDGKPELVTDHKAFQKAFRLASIVLNNDVLIIGLEKITHYHTRRVFPKWAHKFKPRASIGLHIFYQSD
tara:strand:+ start:29 stop:538 length:510 start_codon:yes stop_codon:yes gene_type:complete